VTPADGFAAAPLDGLTRIAAPDPLALATSLAAAAASVAFLSSRESFRRSSFLAILPSRS
jgi:hypothetical protein